MRGYYTASFKVSAATQAQTLVYITATTGKPVELVSTSVTNCTNETNEQMETKWSNISSLGTPTANTITPTKMNQNDSSASCTVKGPVTGSEPTYASGPALDHGYKGWPSLAGYEYEPPPDARPVIGSAASWGLRLLNAPTSLDLVVNVVFREFD